MRQGLALADRYLVEERAARGGMGEVWRARDRVAGTPCAVKFVRADLHDAGPATRGDATSTLDALHRFGREARILAGLRHASIVAYIDHGTTDDGLAWMAMEWLDGVDLRRHLSNGPLDVPVALDLARRIAEALGAAHAAGVVHRDVKPSNVFLRDGRPDRVVVLDFGVAQLGAARASTASGRGPVGTPDYMAPEQARTETRIDARADVFSLGCVLYECLAGRPPFQGEHALAVLAKILFEEPEDVRAHRPEVAAATAGFVRRLLSKEAAARPADGAAAARALADLADETAHAHDAPHDADGAPATGTGGTAPAAALTRGERRLVSVVLAGPTLPAAVVERLRPIAAAYGGRAEPVRGGAVAVLLASTGAATDRAAHAARCALAMRDACPGIALALATGHGAMDTRAPGGEVAVGDAIDRAVDLLRRSTATAATTAHGAIRIDDATAGLLDALFDVGEAGEAGGLVLRGARSAAPAAARLLLGRETPTVGRDRELRLLETTLDECATDQVARAVVVTGAAGVGKSRLRWEVLRRLEASGRPFQVLLGRGDPMSAGASFGVLGGALRAAAAIAGGEAAPVRCAKLRGRVSRNVPAAHVDRVAAFVGELCGVPFPDEGDVQLRAARRDAGLMGDQTLRAFEDLVAAECDAAPQLLVLEDLQWGDAATVRYVDAILGHLRNRPLCVLALARPELDDAFPDLWQRRDPLQVRLGELGRGAAERLARAVLGENARPEAVAAAVDRAAGNAFYLEELLRAVAEGRGAALPETVLAMVQARLEGLEPEARRLLRAAAVFGQTFWRGGIAALLGGTERADALRPRLDDLCEREFVERRRGPSRFADEVEYVFRHSLVREAAYGALTDEDRALGHRLAGEWLVAAGEPDASVLAEHFDRGGDAERTSVWFRRAAEQALHAHDFDAALARAARALAASSDPLATGALERVRAEAYRWKGAFAEAEAAASKAVEHLPPGSADWFGAMEELVNAAGRRGDYAAAARRAEEAAGRPAPPDGSEERAAQVVCLCTAARTLFHAGNYAHADLLLARVAALCADEAAADPRALAEMHRLRGARARHVGDLAGDVGGYERALRAFERAGDARSAANARVSLGFACAEVGDYAAARAHLEAALAEAVRMNLDPVATRARQNLGLVCAETGAPDQASALLERVVAESRAQGNLRFEAWTRIYWSNALRAIGDFAAAEREARTAAEQLVVSPPARAGALAALARALVAQGQAAAARALAREAVGILRAFGGIEEFDTAVWLAEEESARAAGEPDAATAALRDGAARLRARAAAIEDAVRAAAFVERVPDNALLLRRAATLGAAPTSEPGLAAALDPEHFRREGHALVDLLADHLREVTRRPPATPAPEPSGAGGATPVLRWTDPDELRGRWRARFADAPTESPAALFRRLLEDAVQQHHPRYAGYQVTPPFPLAALVELEGALLNNGMAAYDAGPPGSVMEAEIVRWMCERLGYPSDADGVLTSGGSLGNLTALLAARQAKGGGDVWDEGAPAGASYCVLAAGHAHYSVGRAVRVMGWGRHGVVEVPVDAQQRLRPDALAAADDAARRAGRTPLAVVASAGSTSTGAMDPLDAVADFCAAAGLWLHVDGAHGASLVLSERLRPRVRGIERADSVVWDAHKLLHMPALATAVLFRDGARSWDAFSQSAAYLFAQGDPRTQWYNRGVRTLECTKRMMAAPLYFSLAALGVAPFREALERTVDVTTAFAAWLRAQPDFEVPIDPACNILCFRHVPPATDGTDLDALQDGVRSRVVREGRFFLSRTAVAGRVFLRVTVMNARTTLEDLVALAGEVRATARRSRR